MFKVSFHYSLLEDERLLYVYTYIYKIHHSALLSSLCPKTDTSNPEENPVMEVYVNIEARLKFQYDFLTRS